MLIYTDNQKAYLTLAVTNQIIHSVAIADGSFTLDGNLDFPRNITISVTTSNITGGTVTVNGINFITGRSDSEVLDLSSATTLTGTKIFSTITSVVVADLSTADPQDPPVGTFIVGMGNTIQLTVGKSILVNAIVGSGASQVGKYQFIDNITGTTTNLAELKQAIAAGVYEFNASVALGLRVVMAGATPITITYSQ